MTSKKPKRALADYSAFKLNSVGCLIGLLPDDPGQRSLVSSGTNWEHVPSSLILEGLTEKIGCRFHS